MTLPTGSSWSAVGQALRVPYEAPQGRRINVIGAYFSHGPEVGRFEYASYASPVSYTHLTLPTICSV